MKPAQVRMARAALNWSLDQLAGAAGVHRNTVSNFETGKYAGDPEKLAAMRLAIEAVGLEFTNGGQPGVRFATRRAAMNAATRYIREKGAGSLVGGPASAPANERRKAILALCDELDDLARQSETRPIRYRDAEIKLDAIRALGAFLTNEVAGAIAEVFHRLETS